VLRALLEAEASDHPDRVAVSVGPDDLTMAELDAHANGIAHELLARGVAPGDVVGVAVTRSYRLLPALYGVMKSGAAYLPIDPHLPPKRICEMLERARVRAVIADALGRSAIATTAPPAGIVAVENGQASARRPSVPTTASHTAYVIFTSGSTGKPKGVVIENGNVAAFAQEWPTAVAFRRGQTIGSLTTVAFDIFLAETFIPLVSGMRVALAAEDEVETPDAVAGFLSRARCDVLQVTPARLNWLLANPASTKALRRLATVIVGGEAFPEHLLDRLTAVTRASVYNAYGPTEATVWVSAKRVTPGHPITIGRPIAGVRYQTRRCATANDDESDELVISGTTVGQGYLDDDDATEHAFDSGVPGCRRYRTGDRVRMIGAEFAIVGRVDDQVKIDGYRVELGEVEEAIAQAPGVVDAAAALIPGSATSSLVALVAPVDADVGAVRAHVAEYLPRYMTPTTIVAVGDLPMTVSGKRDRHAVRDIVAAHLRTESGEDPLVFLRRAAALLLSRDVPATAPGLIELGVGSLATARLIAEMEERYRVTLRLEDVIKLRSLRAIADLVRTSAPLGP
jgi:amino acid adenylation domain-containing protein